MGRAAPDMHPATCRVRGRHGPLRCHSVAVRQRRIRVMPDLQQRTLALRTSPREAHRSRLPLTDRLPDARPEARLGLQQRQCPARTARARNCAIRLGWRSLTESGSSRRLSTRLLAAVRISTTPNPVVQGATTASTAPSQPSVTPAVLRRPSNGSAPAARRSGELAAAFGMSLAHRHEEARPAAQEAEELRTTAEGLPRPQMHARAVCVRGHETRGCSGSTALRWVVERDQRTHEPDEEE